MTFTQSALSVLIVVALALAAVAVLLDIALLVSLRRRRKDSSKLPQGERLELQLGTQGKQVQRLEAAVRRLAKGERQLGESLRATIQHVAVVRFDAFEDMGGRLSFSAALLDANGDGVVITSINGRQDTRCYAKRVQRTGPASTTCPTRRGRPSGTPWKAPRALAPARSWRRADVPTRRGPRIGTHPSRPVRWPTCGRTTGRRTRSP